MKFPGKTKERRLEEALSKLNGTYRFSAQAELLRAVRVRDAWTRGKQIPESRWQFSTFNSRGRPA